MTVKVISGDDPRTVAAIARQAGLEGEAADATVLTDEMLEEACERYTLALVTREKNLPADTAALARLEKKLTCAEEGKAHQIPEIIMWV